MSNPARNITIPVDLTNPGQFFACCGLLELFSRVDRCAEGWFEGENFNLTADCTLKSILAFVKQSTIANTMTAAKLARLQELSAMSRKEREATAGLDDEKRSLESLRRELPIVLGGRVPICVDWFCDEYTGGSRFKTWAGQQSVLDIAQAMHEGMDAANIVSADTLWNSVRGMGLPFNFDSDLGGQGSARDIGFSFDPLADSEATRIENTCKPALELLCFIGLQRFRPREIKGRNQFVYSSWNVPASAALAYALACGAIFLGASPSFAFSLLYRTKYLKSFLPAQPFQGVGDE